MGSGDASSVFKYIEPLLANSKISLPSKDQLSAFTKALFLVGFKKNEFFFHTMSHLLPSFFCLGRIDIPQKNSYSKYGKSRQDLCVIHEKYTTPTAALLSWVEPADEEVDASAGIFEYKNKGYAEQQGLKEMMCAAGNLVAKVLSTGKRPVIVTIYGMAADYATKKGKLLRLDINFHDNIALSYCSDGIISVSKGVNWMLNGISPRR